MRTFLAMMLFGASALVPNTTADAASKNKRYATPRYYYAPPPHVVRERLVCEERARAEDPAGRYAGYPCWARESFGRGSGGRR